MKSKLFVEFSLDANLYFPGKIDPDKLAFLTNYLLSEDTSIDNFQFWKLNVKESQLINQRPYLGIR